MTPSDSSRLVLLWVIFWIGASTPAQPPRDTLPPAKLMGESATLARRLADLIVRESQAQWPDIIEEYQRIIEENGDDLVPLDARDPRQCLPAWRLCHARLAALPAAARRLYRDRVDEQAKQWLNQGIERRDSASLRRVVERAFGSRSTERALDLLGDMAFERGDFDEAERWWRMLVAPCTPDGLTYPDPEGDGGVVRAKALLCRFYRGERELALSEFKAFRAKHAKAEGLLCGKRGNLGETLQALADQADEVAPTAVTSANTFGGDARRNGILAAAPPLGRLEATWRVALSGSEAREPGKAVGPARAALSLAYHPVIVGDLVVLADARSVTTYDLVTGAMRGRCDLLEDLKMDGPVPDTNRPSPPEARQTVSVADGKIYVRLGARPLIDPRAIPAKPENADAVEARGESIVACLDLAADGKGKLPCRWQVRARAADEPAFFEGSPVVRDGLVFVARTRCVDPTVFTSIDCFDAETGATHWRKDVCEAREQREGKPRFRHHLLTLAGPRIVYCTHSGAIVALEAATGKRAWAARYPRREASSAEGQSSPRDLAPCVYAKGRLLVAPSDADRLFCIDAETGRTLWESRPLEVIHLLGVARDKLIVTTATAPRGIRALDVATGRDLRDWLQPNDGAGDMPTLGRGLLAGDEVFWPTVHGLRVLNQSDGQPSERRLLPGDNAIKGNLAMGGGCLIVATSRELLGFVPEERRSSPRGVGRR